MWSSVIRSWHLLLTKSWSKIHLRRQMAIFTECASTQIYWTYRTQDNRGVMPRETSGGTQILEQWEIAREQFQVLEFSWCYFGNKERKKLWWIPALLNPTRSSPRNICAYQRMRLFAGLRKDREYNSRSIATLLPATGVVERKQQTSGDDDHILAGAPRLAPVLARKGLPVLAQAYKIRNFWATNDTHHPRENDDRTPADCERHRAREGRAVGKEANKEYRNMREKGNKSSWWAGYFGTWLVLGQIDFQFRNKEMKRSGGFLDQV